MESPLERNHRPKNYRTHLFHLFGKDIQIGGMASPDKNSSHVNESMRYLKEKDSIGVLIGLREQSYKELAEKNGLEYHHLPIQDFTQAPVETYDALYQTVKKATDEGKKVTIHCGAGDGRTGTALASLKLRQIMTEAALKDPSILDQQPSRSVVIDLPYTRITAAPCTPFVREAVELTRRERFVDMSNPSDDSGSHSVETSDDLEALMRYELHLKAQIKKELGIGQVISKDNFPPRPTVPPPPVPSAVSMSDIPPPPPTVDLPSVPSAVSMSDIPPPPPTVDLPSVPSVVSMSDIPPPPGVVPKVPNEAIYPSQFFKSRYQEKLPKAEDPKGASMENEAGLSSKIK